MRKDNFTDDGRTVADMSGIGERGMRFSRPAKKAEKRITEPLTREQERQLIVSSFFSAGLIALAFIAAAAALIAGIYFLG